MQYFLTPQQDGWGWSTLLYSPLSQCAKVLVGKNVKVFDIFAWLCISDIKYSTTSYLSVQFGEKTYQFSIQLGTGLSGCWLAGSPLQPPDRGFNCFVGTGTSYCSSAPLHHCRSGGNVTKFLRSTALRPQTAGQIKLPDIISWSITTPHTGVHRRESRGVKEK